MGGVDISSRVLTAVPPNPKSDREASPGSSPTHARHVPGGGGLGARPGAPGGGGPAVLASVAGLQGEDGAPRGRAHIAEKFPDGHSLPVPSKGFPARSAQPHGPGRIFPGGKCPARRGVLEPPGAAAR